MSENVKTMDRRQARTRRALQQALLDLIEQKPWPEITVEDLTEAADIARPTFYAHFPDKAALLEDATQQLLGELSERVLAASPRNEPVYRGAGVAEIFRHADEHRALYRLLTGAEGSGRPRTALVTVLRGLAASVFEPLAESLGGTPPLPMHEITAAFTGAGVAVLHDWLRGEIEGAPEDVAVRFMRGQIGGIEWMLGLGPGTFRFEPA